MVININAIIVSKFRTLLYGLKHRKKVQKLKFNITPEYLNSLYEKSHFCTLSGLDLSFELHKTVNQQNISIDRIDNNKGYEIGNIQLIHKKINMMKGKLSDTEFIMLCKLVSDLN